MLELAISHESEPAMGVTATASIDIAADVEDFADNAAVSGLIPLLLVWLLMESLVPTFMH